MHIAPPSHCVTHSPFPTPTQVLHYSPTLLVRFRAVPTYPAKSGTTPQASTHPRTHPCPVTHRSHHQLPVLHAALYPSPSPAGGSPRGDEEAASFVHPGLHRGEKRMCCESCRHVSVLACQGGGGGTAWRWRWCGCHGLCATRGGRWAER